MSSLDWEGLTRRALGRDSQARETALKDALRAHEAPRTRTSRTRLRAILRLGLADRDVSVRILATEAIGEHGSDADALALRDRLNDPDWAIRASAASSLGRLLGRRARRDLTRLLADENPIVRRFAAVALHDALGA